MFGKQAEIAGEYLKKGSQIYVEGEPDTKQYTDKQGIERYVTSVNCTNFQMLGGRPAESREEKPASKPPQRQQSTASFDDLEDDIPF